MLQIGVKLECQKMLAYDTIGVVIVISFYFNEMSRA